MSEESDRVFENVSVELKRVRRRRMIGKVGALAAVGVLGVFLAQRAMVPHEVPVNRVAGTALEREEPVEPPVGSAQLAVLVYDGEGMRLELRGAEQLSRMEFSLQPVVMGFEEVW